MKTGPLSFLAAPLLFGFVMIVMPGAAPAQTRPNVETTVNIPNGCYLTEPVDPQSMFSFTRVQLQALWLATTGEQANFEILRATALVPLAKISEAIYGLRQERIQDICSAFILSAFSASKNQRMANTADFLVDSYKSLEGMSTQMLEIIQQSILDKNGSLTRTRVAEWKKKRQQIISDMSVAVDFTISQLIDQTRTDPEGKPDHMILTSAQRGLLLDYLRTRFPSMETEKRSGHPGDFMGLVISFQSFLAGKYKPADI